MAVSSRSSLFGSRHLLVLQCLIYEQHRILDPVLHRTIILPRPQVRSLTAQDLEGEDQKLHWPEAIVVVMDDLLSARRIVYADTTGSRFAVRHTFLEFLSLPQAGKIPSPRCLLHKACPHFFLLSLESVLFELALPVQTKSIGEYLIHLFI